jgi:transposase
MGRTCALWPSICMSISSCHEARVSELLCDLYTCQVSEGTRLTWVEFAAERLAATVAKIADWLSAGRLMHADETRMRVAGQLRWLHINSTCSASA